MAMACSIESLDLAGVDNIIVKSQLSIQDYRYSIYPPELSRLLGFVPSPQIPDALFQVRDHASNSKWFVGTQFSVLLPDNLQTLN